MRRVSNAYRQCLRFVRKSTVQFGTQTYRKVKFMHALVKPLTVDSPEAAANDEGNRESTRPIRALNRGLEVLTAN